MSAPTAVHTAMGKSLNGRGGLGRGRCGNTSGDSMRMKLYRY